MSRSKDNIKKVYINPNFSNVPNFQQNMFVNKGFMYVNRQFPLVKENENRNKIFINPNFMRHAQSNVCDQISVDISPSTNKQRVITVTPLNSVLDKQSTEKHNIVNSRYTLIRNQAKTTKAISCVKSNTVKLNRYKLVPITSVQQCSIDLKKQYVSPQTSKSETLFTKFRFENVNFKSTYNNSKVYKNSTSCTKKYISNHRKKTVIERSKLKKNNIPCPLFKKFGKCIRQTNGNCKFLHDKKHVAVCRKFLKGICHEDSCLLSHNVTTKNMPTCYFYLKGMCTKENCPYLHVKLNESSKACSDFLKGYCEKGTKCAYRHVNSVKLKSRVTGKNKIHQLTIKHKMRKNSEVIDIIETNKKDKKNLDCRYYSDAKKETDGIQENINFIKPIRCKLGSLPSFIQL